MPFTSVNKTDESGFTLVEMLVAIAITSIGATAVIPVLQARFRQAAVDVAKDGQMTSQSQYDRRQIVASFTSQKVQVVKLNFVKILTVFQLKKSEMMALRLIAEPSKMGGKNMATTNLRLLSLRNTQNANDQKDLKILISPESVSLNTVGGVTAPRALNSAEVSQPLVIRIRSERLTNQGRGLERCVIMEPTTGEISSGSWHGTSFNSGRCSSSKQ